MCHHSALCLSTFKPTHVAPYKINLAFNSISPSCYSYVFLLSFRKFPLGIIFTFHFDFFSLQSILNFIPSTIERKLFLELPRPQFTLHLTNLFVTTSRTYHAPLTSRAATGHAWTVLLASLSYARPLSLKLDITITSFMPRPLLCISLSSTIKWIY